MRSLDGGQLKRNQRSVAKILRIRQDRCGHSKVRGSLKDCAVDQKEDGAAGQKKFSKLL